MSFISQKTSPLFKIPEFITWWEKWQSKLSRQPQNLNDIMDNMKKHNPAVIPRNHRVEEALAAAQQGDFSIINNLLQALSKPYEESEVYSLAPKSASCNYKTFCGT